MTISDLRELLEGYKATLPEIARDCEQRVVEWRWATELMVSCEPLHDLVTRQGKYWRLPERRWIKDERDGGHFPVQHGFDRDGKFRVWRYCNNFPNHYLIYGENVVDQLWDSLVFTVTRWLIEDGAAIAQYEVSKDGCKETLFERSNGLYRASTSRFCSRHETDFSACEHVDRTSFLYDEHGDLDRVVEQSDRRRKHLRDNLLFIRPRGETLDATLQELEELLVAQIPESIRALSLDDPLYCVAIVYCGEDFCWPSEMCLGTETLRKKLLNGKASQNRWLTLIPGEWPEPKLEPRLWVPSADAKAQELQLRAFQLLDAPNVWLEGEALRPARELLQRVAARLMRIDWSPIAPITDDFVVFMIDDTAEFGSDEDMRASVPPEKLTLLRERGYLWF